MVAPYAIGAGADGRARAACANLQRLSADGGCAGRYGMYEAVDYTPVAPAARPDPRGRALVHGAPPGHGPARRSRTCCSTGRCSAASRPTRSSGRPCCCCRSGCRARRRSSRTSTEHAAAGAAPTPPTDADPRDHRSADTPTPEVQLLSNGRYHVMVTNAGGGYSRWKDLAVTRWREDATRDDWGSFCYLRDVGSGEVWSTAHQPTRRRPAELRGDLLRRPRRVPAPRRRHRHAHRDRRLARGRHRAAPRCASPTTPRSAARSR